jgi:hypothetical protein
VIREKDTNICKAIVAAFELQKSVVEWQPRASKEEQRSSSALNKPVFRVWFVLGLGWLCDALRAFDASYNRKGRLPHRKRFKSLPQESLNF